MVPARARPKLNNFSLRAVLNWRDAPSAAALRVCLWNFIISRVRFIICARVLYAHGELPVHGHRRERTFSRNSLIRRTANRSRLLMHSQIESVAHDSVVTGVSAPAGIKANWRYSRKVPHRPHSSAAHYRHSPIIRRGRRAADVYPREPTATAAKGARGRDTLWMCVRAAHPSPPSFKPVKIRATTEIRVTPRKQPARRAFDPCQRHVMSRHKQARKYDNALSRQTRCFDRANFSDHTATCTAAALLTNVFFAASRDVCVYSPRLHFVGNVPENCEGTFRVFFFRARQKYLSPCNRMGTRRTFGGEKYLCYRNREHLSEHSDISKVSGWNNSK